MQTKQTSRKTPRRDTFVNVTYLYEHTGGIIEKIHTDVYYEAEQRLYKLFEVTRIPIDIRDEIRSSVFCLRTAIKNIEKLKAVWEEKTKNYPGSVPLRLNDQRRLSKLVVIHGGRGGTAPERSAETQFASFGMNGGLNYENKPLQ